MSKVYGPRDSNLYKILITAEYATQKLTQVTDGSGTEKSISGKLPVLETSDGVLSEVNSIARYIARTSNHKHLNGSSPFESALIEQWIDYSIHEIELPASVWVFPIQGKIPNNPAAVQRAKSDIRNILETLDKHLLTRTYLVGQRITLADIVVSMSLYHLYELVLDDDFRKQFVNANRWYRTLVNQPQFKAVLGEVTLCKQAQLPGSQPAKTEEKKRFQI
jgi:elongation factor 1-gamma